MIAANRVLESLVQYTGMREEDEKLPSMFETFLTNSLDTIQLLVDEYGFGAE